MDHPRDMEAVPSMHAIWRSSKPEFATYGQSFLVLGLHQTMQRSHVTDARRATGRAALAAQASN
jgi:hypothetical protein